MQSIIYPAQRSSVESENNGICNVTSSAVNKNVVLPYFYPNGSRVLLGDDGLGFPSVLYPNLTYEGTPGAPDYRVSAANRTLDPYNSLVLGPLITDNDTALLSLTTAIVNNTTPRDVLGWITVVVNASMIFDIRNSQEGLGDTGQVLIVGASSPSNHFDFNIRQRNSTELVGQQNVRFILPPISRPGVALRHADRMSTKNTEKPFQATAFPAVLAAWARDNHAINNAGSILNSHDEQGEQISVGYAQIVTPLVDWVLLVEQSHSETVAPINHLRDIVIICVFSVTGGLLVFTFPLAHYSVAPIRQLRAATKQSVEPYQPDDSHSGWSSSTTERTNHDGARDGHDDFAKKEGLVGALTRWISRSRSNSSTLHPRHSTSLGAPKTFRIPAKVPERKHIVYDELTDLTSKFNEMSDELAMQYQRLEERVKERTAELEQSKKVAEAANQSKTLFIANISHELKTPLNGILGLTTVCMNEDDPAKVRSTLSTIYKSGDLLLHLLTDLLTFSKNEVGQQLFIDEAEFQLSDLELQLLPTFEKQAKEKQINLQVVYMGTNDALGNLLPSDEKGFGPAGTGRVKEMCLWGDKNRLLQVLMNFVSNSLKFTPPDGSVTVRIKCLGLAGSRAPSLAGSARRSSLLSKRSKASGRSKVRMSDTSLIGTSDSEGERGRRQKPKTDKEGKLKIHVGDGTTQVDRIVERRRSASPPPLNTKDLIFEFEVEDTGPGIPPDQQKKIFEPFVQGDLGLSKKYGGTGLGLSICAQLAALMGGELSLDSEVGRGSRFSMRLPLRYCMERTASMDVERKRSIPKPHGLQDTRSPSRQMPLTQTGADPAPQMTEVPRIVGLSQPFVTQMEPAIAIEDDLAVMRQAETEAKKTGKKVRVLVAEDNKINQEVVLRMLKLEDVYDVTIAKDGQEAFEKVRESMQTGARYHLVLMDVQMPNVDGIHATRMIRDMGFTSPIVALTAFAEKSNEDECIASGMDYFLAKPIKRPALKQVLKKYCTTIPEEESITTPVYDIGQASHASTASSDENSLPHEFPELSPKTTIDHGVGR